MEDPADSGGGTADPTGPSMLVTEIRWPAGARPLRLLEWKVKPGSLVNVDSVLALCAPIPVEKEAGSEPREQASRLPEKKVKSDRAGVVKELCCQLGQVISPGAVIVRIEECSHPIVMKGLCAECGQDLTQLQNKNGKQQAPISTATVSMVHSVPELMVSSEQAEQLGREDQLRLHCNRKLVLMVDLDQTLIHTTEQHCQRMSNKGIFHFQLGRGEPMLHTRLRPHCKDFLEKIAKLYELHVFTFGSRLYAHTIAGFLDPEKKLFSHRILSRDECIDPYSKTGNLRNLFPCGDSMVCIIDDREDVWKFAPNLITVKKYTYFQGTGDINAPPGSREAQMARKANHVSKPAEGPAAAAAATSSREGEEDRVSGDRASEDRASGAEEHSNGLRKRGKERGGGRGAAEQEEQAPASQGAPNERTHTDREGAEGAASAGGADTSRVSDTGNVKEEEDGSGAVAAAATEGEAAPATDGTGNELDFDLSSDSESETGTGDPPSSDSEGEGKRGWRKAKEPQAADPTGDSSKGAAEKQPGGEDALEEVPPGTEQEGLQELGNGCPDRKEAETESQNSEQSGVTMGEESLDQSMEEEEEEEEEEEPDLDQDDHLIYLEEVLVRIHSEYYARYDDFLAKKTSEIPDIRKIVPELKSRSLAGTNIVFSGLYPTNYPMERTRECYHAKALGAKVSKNLVLSPKDPSRTTHLIAARAGTEKVRQAQGCKHLHVVNPDWLWGCLERWEKVEEQLFPLKEDYVKTQRSNSPATFPDIQGAFQTPLFHPTPIHPKTPTAPEVRTYDPVTGKLIRRGAQAGPRQPSYIQAPGPPLALHGEQSSFRVVQQLQQQNEAPGSSRDEEQPGPSRRKRQPSMSETMPLYTLCKEDLESMDKEVDDILGEESDNESEGGGKEEQAEGEEEESEGRLRSLKGENSEGLGTVIEERTTTPSSQDSSLSGSVPRGHKRKLEEARESEEADSASESSKESNEDEEGSSSEADEMAAALEAELNDFM
ncbi:RNA polymerase II subunit A C-terminal domain phosphatase isoform X2 [Megalops cyprinoides]|uniref:RNA polymerase II subunit A C-terminal domain phosphatase isoform X2 n=1 Tax=Megalops cyprinoides TaxID=118141 RepID=UPI0018650A75|nr:RNA polymerase II subunit A C-terminal domain phosphatase isoform X2 [Megalops cyprinoides]